MKKWLFTTQIQTQWQQLYPKCYSSEMDQTLKAVFYPIFNICPGNIYLGTFVLFFPNNFLTFFLFLTFFQVDFFGIFFLILWTKKMFWQIFFEQFIFLTPNVLDLQVFGIKLFLDVIIFNSIYFSPGIFINQYFFLHFIFIKVLWLIF